MPNSVRWIGRYAINQCDTVVIEDGNTELGLQNRNADDGYWDGVFSGVKKLYVGRNTALNGSYESDMVFCALNSGSTQLTDVIFGPMVTKAFTGSAFSYCNHVNSVTCLGKEPFTSPDFCQIPQTATLYVPLGSKQQYASVDGWSRFNNITEVTEVTITMDDTEIVYAGDFDLDFSNVDGLKAYVASDFDAEASTITVKPVQVLSAVKGVIIKLEKCKNKVHRVNIETTAGDPLCGTISGRFIRNTEDENVNYAFDKAEHVFKPVDAVYGCLISRNGAYLSLPASSASGNGNITPLYNGVIDVTDISQLSDAIYIVPFSASIGGDVQMEVCLKNAEAATAYVFDLVLPEGVTVAKNAQGKYIDALSDRHDDHTRTFNDKGNNTYSLSTLSGNSEELTGNDGAIRLLTLHVADDVAEGIYAIEIKNASYSKPNGALVQLPNTISSITVEDYVLGDVNGNDLVDIGDAVTIVNYLVGKPSTTFVEKAADTNKNSLIDIGDAVTIVNFLVGKTASLSRQTKMEIDEREPQ